MSEKRSILKTTGLLGAITLVSRFTGLIRDVMIAALLGGSRAADVFWIAFQLPNLTRRVLGEGALSSFVVPLFVSRRQDRGEASGWAFVNRTINTVFLVTLALVVGGMIFSQGVFNVFGGFGMMAEANSLADGARDEVVTAVAHGSRLTRAMMPYMLGLAVASIMMGICHALGSFGIPALGSIVLNIAMIAAGALALALGTGPETATYWLAIATILGAVLRVFIMLPTLRRAGWRWKPELGAGDGDVKKLFGMMGFGLFGLSVAQINIAVALFLAAFLGEGNIAFLTYASRLIQFPMALTATAMATAMLPSLTKLILEGKKEELRDVVGFAKRIDVVLMVPAALGLMFFATPIVALIFQRGEFSETATSGTAAALVFYAPGLLPLGWTRLLLPIFYARKDVKTPVKAAAAAMILNVALGLYFTFYTDLNQRGLALAATLAAFANYFFLTALLKRDPTDPLAKSSMTETLVKCLIAGFVSIGAMAWFYQWAIGTWGEGATSLARAVRLGPFVIASIPCYFGLAHLLRVPDSDRAMRMLMRRKTSQEKP